MRTSTSSTLLLAAAGLVGACATSGAPPPTTSELRPDGGFSISQEVRVDADVRADFARAVALLEQEQYPAGIALLVEVSEAAPQLAAVHIDLGIAHARVGDLEHAEASLERALALDPQHPVARNELGMLYRRTGRFAEARRSYEQALALYPAFHFARRNLAILCDLYLADPDCALEHYAHYVEVAPDDETVAMWAADLRTRHGR